MLVKWKQKKKEWLIEWLSQERVWAQEIDCNLNSGSWAQIYLLSKCERYCRGKPRWLNARWATAWTVIRRERDHQCVNISRSAKAEICKATVHRSIQLHLPWLTRSHCQLISYVKPLQAEGLWNERAFKGMLGLNWQEKFEGDNFTPFIVRPTYGQILQKFSPAPSRKVKVGLNLPTTLSGLFRHQREASCLKHLVNCKRKTWGKWGNKAPSSSSSSFWKKYWLFVCF
jgi:hypothetical protein